MNWKHLNPPVGALKLDRISVGMVEELRDDLISDGKLSHRSVNAILTTGAAVFQCVLRRGLVRRNPFQLAERAKGPACEIVDVESDARKGPLPVTPDRVLTPGEIARLLESARPGCYRILLTMAATTGMRIGELTALRWSDVQFNPDGTGKVFVRRSLSWARGAGEIGPLHPRFCAPKTKAGLRTISISGDFARVLKTWKVACPAMDTSIRDQAGYLVFPTAGGLPLNRLTVLKCGLRPTLRKAKLRDIGLHGLRHSFASILIASGAPITEVQGLLGHSNPNVTLGVYAHWFKNAETGSVARVSSLILSAKNRTTSENRHEIDTISVEPEARIA